MIESLILLVICSYIIQTTKPEDWDDFHKIIILAAWAIGLIKACYHMGVLILGLAL